MPPRMIYCVRHAEGHHNVRFQHFLRDPPLTAVGHVQCSVLAKKFPYKDRITHIISSPLKRTLQTTIESFHPVISRLSTPAEGSTTSTFNIRVDPNFQETGEWECDIGSTVPSIQEFLSTAEEDVKKDENVASVSGYQFTDLFDLSQIMAISPVWPNKHGDFAASNVAKRAETARQWLYDNFSESDEVLIVTHGGFLHWLASDWVDFDEVKGTAWRNTDWRAYTLEKKGGKVAFKETEESSKNRDKQTGVRGQAEADDGGREEAEVEAGGHHKN